MSKKLTQQEFVQKAQAVHGNAYDFSISEYINSLTEVGFICPIHGVVKKRPAEILRGKGCPLCGRKKGHETRRWTTEQFIEEARKIYGDHYGYSKVVYKDANSPVIITCPVHGDFPQRPYVHLHGHGCAKCSNGTMSEQEFIKKARAKYGNRFDYSLVKITGNQTKVKIICPIHGIIEQTPYNHLKFKNGCYKCVGINGYTTEDFIRKSKEMFGDRYDYSQTVYRGSLEDVTLICRKHGPFRVNAENHLSHGQGCRICNLGSRTTEEFIEDARKVHGDKYEYSKSVYAGINNPIIVTCREHGDFETNPHALLRGYGCPKCSMSQGEMRIEKYLEAHGIPHVYEEYIYTPMATGTMGAFVPDFLLPNDNGPVTIIEYHGKQHFKKIDYMGGEEKFGKRKERDAALRRYCEIEGIRLIEIPYTDFDRIEEILDREL